MRHWIPIVSILRLDRNGILTIHDYTWSFDWTVDLHCEGFELATVHVSGTMGIVTLTLAQRASSNAARGDSSLARWRVSADVRRMPGARVARDSAMRYARHMATSINSEGIVRDVIVIGASAGGIQAVIELLSRLPEDLPAFIGVVIHRGGRSQSNWSHTLGKKTKLRVVEPANGDALTRGVVYIAPSDCHMTFGHGKISLDGSAKQHHTRPAVDPLFMSAALAYGARVVGVVLTGGGHDGMQGLLGVTNAGGLSLVQKPSEAEDASMPAYAIAGDHVKAALTVDEIGDVLVRLARGSVVSVQGAEALAQLVPPQL